MNELIFFCHVLFVIGSIFVSLKFGKIALHMIAASMAVFANLFVIKEMSLFGLTVTCSDVYSVGVIFSLNLLQEFFGKEEAKRAIYYCFAAMFFFGIVSFFHLSYVPWNPSVHSAYEVVLSKTTRLILASYVSFYLAQRFDIAFFGFLKKKFSHRSLSARTTLSLIVVQAIDTVIFSYLGLYSTVSNLSDVMIMSYMSKILIIFCSSPLTLIWRKYVHKDAAV